MKTMLTLPEVADHLGVTEATVRRRIKAGKMQAPTRFVGREQTPKWNRREVDKEGVAPTGVRVSREMHLQQLLDEARLYAWQHNGAPIPQSANGRVRQGRAFPLGSRVSSLRGQKKAGRLEAEWVEKFEAIPGWSWDRHDSEWNARFDEVASRWPDKLTERDKSWLTIQRARRKKLRTEWLVRFLDYPGMLAPTGRGPVEEFVAAARQWLDENPDHLSTYSMPFRAKVMRGDNDPYPVGRRATYYRRRYAGLEGREPLSDDDVEKIEELPGWSWEMSPTHTEAQAWRRGRPASETINRKK